MMSGLDLEALQSIMSELFGETPARSAVAAYNERIGRSVRHGKTRYDRRTGRLILPGVAGAGLAAPASGHAARSHTFYGQQKDNEE